MYLYRIKRKVVVELEIVFFFIFEVVFEFCFYIGGS